MKLLSSIDEARTDGWLIIEEKEGKLDEVEAKRWCKKRLKLINTQYSKLIGFVLFNISFYWKNIYRLISMGKKVQKKGK